MPVGGRLRSTEPTAAPFAPKLVPFWGIDSPLELRWHLLLGMSGGFVGATLRRLSAIDLDELFSYNTKKEVRMLDRRLGYLCWSVRLLVWGYIVGYVFIANEGYTQQETAHGHVLTSVEGSTFSMTRTGARAWDAVDASRPSLENGALFIATQVLHTQGQVMGNCTSPTKKCSLDADCEKRPPLAEGICSAGMCWEMQWCPAQSETGSDLTDIHSLEGSDGFTIWFKAAIQFTSLDATRIFSTMAEHVPVRYAAPAAKARPRPNPIPPYIDLALTPSLPISTSP